MTIERDQRLVILNTLLTTPHRDLAGLHPLHHDLCERDPRFYVRLAAWYADRGEVRDHKEMFVVTLCLSTFEGHRDVGLALLRNLPPYEVGRVVDFVHAPGSLARNVPRSLRTEVERYLREREADPRWLDGSILHARKAIKRLYALLHIQPSPRAQAILFDEHPPEDSSVFAVRAVARAATPMEQAESIIQHRLPYRVAASVVKEMTPEVVRALIEVMSPQELINNFGSLKARGALEDTGVQEQVRLKLAEARKNDRVSAFKTRVATEAANLSGPVAEQLDQVAEARVKARGKITRPTALLIDKSGSMQAALEIARQLGAMISTLCQNGLWTYAFDTKAHLLKVAQPTLAGWEDALAGVTCGGSTSCGCAIEALAQAGQRVDQILFVTDEQENAPPHFKDALRAYQQKLDVRPSVVLVKVGQSSDQLERACRELGVMVSAFEFKGDYYALPNVVPLLSQPSMSDLLAEIIEYPLPRRKPAVA
jgi:hypothetical protein